MSEAIYPNKSFDSLKETKDRAPRGTKSTPRRTGFVTVRVVKEYAGIPIGHQQAAREKDAVTQHMLREGYWEIV